ncbi:MAG TPA: transposase [Ktedonobacteraceae bacterium]
MDWEKRPNSSSLDNAPPHHPKRVQEAAAAAQIEMAWLPFRSPELNPCEDLWRVRKRGDCGQPGVCLAGGRGRASGSLARQPHQ